MKMLLIVIAVVAVSCSHDIAANKVPSVVLNTLKAQQPAADKVDWEKKKNLYEAEFNIDTTEVTVQIDAAGKLIMQKQDVSAGALPSNIVTLLNQQYKAYKLDDVEKLQKDGVSYYQLQLNSKGKKDVLLVLNEDGTMQKDVLYWD